jgi:hypothetical protein
MRIVILYTVADTVYRNTAHINCILYVLALQFEGDNVNFFQINKLNKGEKTGKNVVYVFAKIKKGQLSAMIPATPWITNASNSQRLNKS